jgi:hypothetical protein
MTKLIYDHTRRWICYVWTARYITYYGALQVYYSYNIYYKLTNTVSIREVTF